MKLTKKHLRQIIREELTRVLSEADSDGDGSLDADELRDLADKLDGGASAEFDRDSVMLNGQALDQEELASQVSSPSQWMDNFDLMGMYAAQALRDIHGVTTITDYEQPGESWTVDEFIALKKRIAEKYDED